MRRLLAAAALLSLSCASADAPPPAPAPAATDPRVAELQVALTELLERLDVMNDRISRIEEARTVTARPAEASQPASTVAAPVPAPQRAVVGAALAERYRTAMALYGKGSYGEARREFEAVFAADETGDLADNALFWIGETYFAGGDFVNAMKYYGRIVREYGSTNKAPDALLKTALAQARTGDLSLARRTLQQVIADYPYSGAAQSAKTELERIRF